MSSLLLPGSLFAARTTARQSALVARSFRASPLSKKSLAKWRYVQHSPILQARNLQSSSTAFGHSAGYSRDWWIRVASTTGAVALGTVGINYFLNRETRDALSAHERNYLNGTFGYLGAGLTLAAGTAFAMHRNGISARIMRANPWAVMGVSIIGGIGSMLGVFYTNPNNKIQKHLCYFAFQGFQAMTLSPLFFLNPALLARAGLYTVGMMGSLCYVGATAQSTQYLYMGGPLMAGLVVVALSGLAPLILPATALGTIAFTQALSLYGGLAVFGGFTLYDTQKILHHAQLVQQGRMQADPMRESISLELDFINIFIRMVSILAGQQSRKR